MRDAEVLQAAWRWYVAGQDEVKAFNQTLDNDLGAVLVDPYDTFIWEPLPLIAGDYDTQFSVQRLVQAVGHALVIDEGSADAQIQALFRALSSASSADQERLLETVALLEKILRRLNYNGSYAVLVNKDPDASRQSVAAAQGDQQS